MKLLSLFRLFTPTPSVDRVIGPVTKAVGLLDDVAAYHDKRVVDADEAIKRINEERIEARSEADRARVMAERLGKLMEV